MEEGLVDAIQNYGNKICRSCCLHDGIPHDGMHAETLKIHLPKASEVSSSLALFPFKLKHAQ